MNLIRHIPDPVAVVGWACRVPGAESVPALWSMLREGRCAIDWVPQDRFAQDAYLHPRKNERGRTYTFAAGTIRDIWNFDPAVFQVSPREAEQMDPQQRILLQLTWEALESAGIAPSSIAGTNVGVFVGGSLTDYAHAFYGDPAVGDSHFATGNALAALSNRISYGFNLHGPSLTIDTACSSSLVALHQAAEAIRAGRIDTAIVGGINIIASPASFITFSQASMVSPTGRCRAFDADADGFVRGEGGVTLVLRRSSLAEEEGNPIRGVILGSDVNSDGRTSGISLPSAEAQEDLLTQLYARTGVQPQRLAFMEAHGTGTPVGDPIEAAAIGRSVAWRRETPLLLGSIKTNIGHLEPASGLAGVLKALLALEHRVLPRSLSFKEPNPNIDFETLNLEVCAEEAVLPQDEDICAGVNSFGFGGTNAHVVLGPGAPQAALLAGRPKALLLSAATRTALNAMAERYRERLTEASDVEAGSIAAAVAFRRDRLAHRLVVSSGDRVGMLGGLDAYLQGKDCAWTRHGSAAGSELPTAFVFTGNGGRLDDLRNPAFFLNPVFRERFEEIDEHFAALAHWSLKAFLASDPPADRQRLTSVVQPLLFAVQSAAVAALTADGLKPQFVLGHSVGEIAAAQAAGILSTQAAVEVIHHRSRRQEMLRGTGGMAAVSASREELDELVGSTPGLQIAAINGPRTATIAGSATALSEAAVRARTLGLPMLDLGIEYPFHTDALDQLQGVLAADLGHITPSKGHAAFVSTVTGEVAEGRDLDEAYWWRNVRAPVLFEAAVREAARLGCRCFVEVGPTSLLMKHMTSSLQDRPETFAFVPMAASDADGRDPFEDTVSRALIAGAEVEAETVFGSDPGGGVGLPTYPWDQRTFRLEQTSEAIGTQEHERHRYAGVRLTADALEWRGFLDTARCPELGDHAVGGQVLFPATAFLELGFAAGERWFGDNKVTLANFEILSPLDLTSGETAEVMTRIGAGTGLLEILTRPRFSGADWTLNCRSKVMRARPLKDDRPYMPPEAGAVLDGEGFYAVTRDCGFQYGPEFARIERHVRVSDDEIHVALEPRPALGGFVVNPLLLDACFQGLIAVFPELDAMKRGVAYIPVRVDEALVAGGGEAPTHAVIKIRSRSDRSILNDITVFGADGRLVVSLKGARCIALPLKRVETLETAAMTTRLEPADGATLGVTGVAASTTAFAATAQAGAEAHDEAADGQALLETWALAASREIAEGLGQGGPVAPDTLAEAGRLPRALTPWLSNLLRRLEGAGFARSVDGSWIPTGGPIAPPSRELVAALVDQAPGRAAEILGAAEITELAESALTLGRIEVDGAALSSQTTEFWSVSADADGELQDLIGRTLAAHAASGERALRLLLLGSSLLPEALAGLGLDLRTTVVEPDPARFARLRELADGSGRVRLSSDIVGEPGEFDLIIAADVLNRIAAGYDLGQLVGLLAPAGMLMAAEPCPSLFRDLASGLNPDWFAAGPSGRLRGAEDWAAAFEAAGLTSVTTAAAGRSVSVIFGKTPALSDAASTVTLPDTADTSIEAAIAQLDPPTDARVHVVKPIAGDEDPVAALTQRCLAIRTAARDSAESLWIVFAGALGAADADPVMAGAFAFSKTLANEYAHLEVRMVDVASDVTPGEAARRIAGLFTAQTPERQFRIEADTIRVVRAVGLPPTPAGSDTGGAARLQRGSRSARRLQWTPATRIAPGPNEVEVEVAASAINFRDFMWAVGLLPEDMLEGGFAGANLGLECAGKVVRVGEGAEDFKVGDLVTALSGSALSSHVTVAALQVSRIPEGMALEAAATIPVAGLTAYYSLVTQARLQKGEWVLIHGGAGGVGLAAIQIAKGLGARIIATAGSKAKRSLLRSLGVDHVLDSRSTLFVQAIQEITGRGVQVVLNSLSQDSMELSLACLAPFGRFVELGKRDFAADTHIGLRVFRNNISYFAVDVDQLVGEPALAAQVLSELGALVAEGALRPLPYTVFDAERVSEAFGLMQRSAHIGKLVVRPPAGAYAEPSALANVIDLDGAHLVTGAFGGFGLETAKWLVRRGVRHLILLGRSGPVTSESKLALAAFAEAGIQVLAEPCDVGDPEALTRVLAKAAAAMPPIVGVFHAAMVLDDALIDDLDEIRFRKVLEPKIKGVDNLDRLTRSLPLTTFVLYSSVTTLFGNPGQGAYVAANAYLEGVARRRRAKGLPALAVGWGPISDVGVVARNSRLQEGLRKLTGARSLTAREALDLLERALAYQIRAPELADLVIAPNDGAFSSDRLAVLASPTYAALTVNGRAGEDATATIDLAALIAAEGRDVAIEKVGDVIARELAHVLHTEESEIGQSRPLIEFGIDSLMALELALRLEETFSLRLPLRGSVGAMTVAKLAATVVGGAGRDGGDKAAPSPAKAQDRPLAVAAAE